MWSCGENDVEKVGYEDRPEEGNCTQKEEYCEKAGNAKGVGQDQKGLQPALQGDREGGEMDAGRVEGISNGDKSNGSRERFVLAFFPACSGFPSAYELNSVIPFQTGQTFSIFILKIFNHNNGRLFSFGRLMPVHS